MDRAPPFVAVGLLTQRDLDLLGAGFRNAFPIPEGAQFDHLIKAIDDATRDRSPPPAPLPGRH